MHEQKMAKKMKRYWCLILALAFYGCGDTDTSGINNGSSFNTYGSSSQSFRGYTGPASSMQIGMNQRMTIGMSSQPLISPHSMSQLQDSQSRLEFRKAELGRLMHELDVDKSNYEMSLRNVGAEYEQSKQRIQIEFENNMNFMRNMAQMQTSYPTDAMYFNAYPPINYYSSPFVNQGLLTPISLQPSPRLALPSLSVDPGLQLGLDTSALSVTPLTHHHTEPRAVSTGDLTKYKDLLNQFIDTCISVANQSSTGAPLVSVLSGYKSQVIIIVDFEGLKAIATQVNELIPRINSLPRKTISEVWIDPTQVASVEDREKLNKLVLQESQISVGLNEANRNYGEEINTGAEIPNLFSYASSEQTHNHRLKVLRDYRSNQIRVMATCNYSVFHGYPTSTRDRWFFSFTCESTNSMNALAESGSNSLGLAVLKVVCHSKEFSKELVLNQMNRTDRCLLSKWSDIGSRLNLSPNGHYHSSDSTGKNAWRMLREGSGCFNRSENLISSKCAHKSRFGRR